MSLVKIAAAGLLCVVGAASAQAASYITTVSYEVPDANGDTLQIEWSTGLTSGDVTEVDLTDLTFLLYGDGALLFTDQAIIGGAVQSIGGVARDIDDLLFNFSFAAFALDPSGGLVDFDNDTGILQDGDATGLTYNLYGDGLALAGALNIDYFFDGAGDGSLSNSEDVANELTVALSADVPLPAGVLLLPAALVGLGAVARRRRRAA